MAAYSHPDFSILRAPKREANKPFIFMSLFLLISMLVIAAITVEIMRFENARFESSFAGEHSFLSVEPLPPRTAKLN